MPLKNKKRVCQRLNFGTPSIAYSNNNCIFSVLLRGKV